MLRVKVAVLNCLNHLTAQIVILCSCRLIVGITSISNLDRCVSLIDLNLSNNSIPTISGLDTLTSLQRLDLSYNRITRVGMRKVYIFFSFFLPVE